MAVRALRVICGYCTFEYNNNNSTAVLISNEFSIMLQKIFLLYYIISPRLFSINEVLEVKYYSILQILSQFILFQQVAYLEPQVSSRCC